MASTLTCIYLHVVFSTKNREPRISADLADRLYAYIGGACEAHGCTLILAGGVPDHVHLLVSLGKTIAVADLLREIKVESSKWLKLQGVRSFAWQDGYAAFSIGESQRGAVEAYIRNQARHHTRMTFEEELVALLDRYGVSYDRRYVLG